MPFKEKSRRFWMDAADGKCQYEEYDEKRGWHECGKKAKQVHHIEPESKTLYDGGDPERSVGLPLCENHHSRNTGDVLGESNASFHPEMGEAYNSYSEWKANQQHMNEINGRTRIDYSTSPFSEAGRDYHERAQNGERICSGDEGTDYYYTDKMRRKAIARGREKPDTSPHKDADPKKKKHWWDGLFG